MLNLLLLALSAGASALASNAVTTSDALVRRAATPAFKVVIGPKPPFKPMPVSTPRDRDCIVKGGTADDSAAILAAITSCNGGGRVIFSKGTKYTIGKALDLTKLNKIDLVIQGDVTFSNDKAYWSANAFKHTFQNAVSYFQIGGTDVNVYGGGTIDGNGAAWPGQGVRPILFCVNGLKGGQIANLNLVNSPQWFNLIRDSSDVVYDHINIKGKNKNTDGWDFLRSTNIVVQNSVIDNGDDCVSFKPGSVDIVVQGLVCIGSHGCSVGSLGQYPEKVDIVENIMAYNISLTNASNGARIKAWPASGDMSGVGHGGGGKGTVSNIVFDTFKVSGVESAITVTQCYGQKDLEVCAAQPSKVTFSNISFINFSGTAKGKKGAIGMVTCSTATSCKNISFKNIAIGAGKITCTGYKGPGCS